MAGRERSAPSSDSDGPDATLESKVLRILKDRFASVSSPRGGKPQSSSGAAARLPRDGAASGSGSHGGGDTPTSAVSSKERDADVGQQWGGGGVDDVSVQELVGALTTTTTERDALQQRAADAVRELDDVTRDRDRLQSELAMALSRCSQLEQTAAARRHDDSLSSPGKGVRLVATRSEVASMTSKLKVYEQQIREYEQLVADMRAGCV
jgi:hypothetical protein